MTSNCFISVLTPGELSVSFKSPENPLARGVQFPQHTKARVVEEREDEEDVPRQPRMTRSQSVRGPVRDAQPHEPARHLVDPGKRPAPHTSSSSSGSRPVSSPSEGEVDRKWVKKTIRQEMKKFFGKFMDKLKGKGKKDRGKSKHFRGSDSPPLMITSDGLLQRTELIPALQGPTLHVPATTTPAMRNHAIQRPCIMIHALQIMILTQQRPGITTRSGRPCNRVRATTAMQNFDWSTYVYPHASSPFLRPEYRTEQPIYFAESLTSLVPYEWGQSCSAGPAQTEEPEPHESSHRVVAGG
ncbi:uncharacterized protein LOC131011389 [Salvia miltiorrhiza]|uniref:uncharacterized protein LOC131011389 n=1 Tax=Salvia miltiorrhiza TaxID=226208 RepID=UPI0025AB9831|nr:uncharacterized protein LOC131011389 [Salvia miltiorrhiza]